ncbi:MAG: hypothetical protein CMJ18_10320 [Phycisphaeraceae bacterium]|nr:hypothetical protein [Phycisphaeraceae bacterium]
MRRRFSSGTVVIVALALIGCRTSPPDPGTTGGRIDPYRTTSADRASTDASMPALYEYSDVTAEALVRSLAELDEVKSATQPLVLELGGIENHTGTPTGDFELIQHRLRGAVRRSQIARKHFIFVESTARMDSELRRVDADGPDLTSRYPADRIYLLVGDFFESARGRTRRYYFEFQLLHLSTRRIIFNEPFDLAQR